MGYPGHEILCGHYKRRCFFLLFFPGSGSQGSLVWIQHTFQCLVHSQRVDQLLYIFSCYGIIQNIYDLCPQFPPKVPKTLGISWVMSVFCCSGWASLFKPEFMIIRRPRVGPLASPWLGQVSRKTKWLQGGDFPAHCHLGGRGYILSFLELWNTVIRHLSWELRSRAPLDRWKSTKQRHYIYSIIYIYFKVL